MDPLKAGRAAAVLAASVLVLTLSGNVKAVVIQSSGGSAPPLGIDNVGKRGAGSAIYVGNGWVMTANHVGKGSVMFGSTSYGATSDPAIQLHNPGSSDLTDIILFKLKTDPGLPALDIAATSPTSGQTVTMIGYGRQQADDLTYWDKQGSTWVVVSDPGAADYSGYTTSSAHSLSWGTNTVENAESSTYLNGLAALTFTTQMDNSAGDEAQGVEGDSGGAVFGTDGLLMGMMVSVNRHAGQPDNTAVYDNLTHMMRLPEYRDQIVSMIALRNVIPEPVSAALMGLAAMTALRRRKRAHC